MPRSKLFSNIPTLSQINPTLRTDTYLFRIYSKIILTYISCLQIIELLTQQHLNFNLKLYMAGKEVKLSVSAMRCLINFDNCNF